jgi:peptide/nickel transport system permease protein
MLSDAATTGTTSIDSNMIIPGLAIVITVVAFNLPGDGLRDLLDPRSSR